MAPARSSTALSIALAVSFTRQVDSFHLQHDARSVWGWKRPRSGRAATLMLAEPARPARAARAQREPSEEENKKYLANLELEYWGSLDPHEYKAARRQAVGVEMLKLGELEDALAAFDEALEARPEMYLWHRGITLYYLGHYSAAANHFLRDAGIFERRFEEAATDDRIWAAAALLRSGSNAAAAAAATGNTAAAAAAGAGSGEGGEEVAPVVAREQNALKAAVLDLFLGRGSREAVRDVMGLPPSSPASPTGDVDTDPNEDTDAPALVKMPRDYTGRRFFGHFYLSLWHECQSGGGGDAAARRELAAAMATGFPRPGSGDFWLQLPPLVAKIRGWDIKPSQIT